MQTPDPVEYECLQCEFRQPAEDALLTICPRCGGEMRNVSPISN